MLPACPDCGSALGRGATKCRCGWKTSAVSEHRKITACAYENCVTPAIVREKTGTGWATFCEYHMLKEHTKRAEKWCSDHGLFTREQKIAYCREMFKRTFPGAKFPEPREPGCDDEPVRKFMPDVEPKVVSGS